MKSRKLLMYTLTAGTLLFAGAIAAQEAPVPMPPAPTTTSTDGHAATYQTPQGELTVRSVVAPAPSVGPAPSFQQLSAGGKAITEEQANVYPALANDFLHADQNRNGSISASEYAKWLKQM